MAIKKDRRTGKYPMVICEDCGHLDLPIGTRFYYENDRSKVYKVCEPSAQFGGCNECDLWDICEQDIYCVPVCIPSERSDKTQCMFQRVTAMAVSRGENYNKIKNSKISTVFGGEYLEIGTVFRIARDMRSALYEVRACQDTKGTKWCQDCGLSNLCKINAKYVPECSAFNRDDNLDVYFNLIY